MTGGSEQDDDANALLGDLESIRSLLDESDSAANVAAAGSDEQAHAEADGAQGDSADAGESSDEPGVDDDVPVLDDVIDGALTLSEAELDSDSQRSLATDVSTEQGASTPSGGLSDEVMSALLDDDWRTRAENLLAGARQDIENNREDWQPEYTDELTDALQVRIDATVHDWIGRTLTRHIDELRGELVNALSVELSSQVRAKLDATTDDDAARGEER